jgi:type I restriction enzyme S subunit
VGDVNMAEVSCCIGRGVAAVRHKTGSRSYTYYAMQALKAYFDQFESDGTVFGSISKSGFAAIPFLIPASKLVESFESVAFLIDQLIEINEKQTRSLTALRDALLPRLISGELRVGEAEELVEELL